MTSPTPRTEADRRAEPTPGLDPTDQPRPDLPTPITADEVTILPPDRTPHAGDASTDAALTFERS